MALSSDTAQLLIYRPAVPAEHCYLAEVLLWHAFGRFPEEMRLPGMAEDWRFCKDSREDFEAPHPGGFVLSMEECAFASLAPDPLGLARAKGVELRRPQSYPQLLEYAESWKGKDSDLYKSLAYELEVSKLAHRDFDGWSAKFNSYVDRFRIEILHHLQQGRIKSWGTKLPYSDRRETTRFLLSNNMTLVDLEVLEISPTQWVSDFINWQESSLANAEQSLIWIHLRTSDILRAFPPKRILEGTSAGILPDGKLVTAAPAIPEALPANARGRPPLPWDRFHVEVAKMFRDGSMHPKQEAAIENFISWFKEELGLRVGRSTISQRLKPYYDELIRSKSEI